MKIKATRLIRELSFILEVKKERTEDRKDFHRQIDDLYGFISEELRKLFKDYYWRIWGLSFPEKGKDICRFEIWFTPRGDGEEKVRDTIRRACERLNLEAEIK